jgi:RNA polymerase sigma-70 factor (ECF subfamily)
VLHFVSPLYLLDLLLLEHHRLMVAADKAFKELFDREYQNLCRYALSYLQDSHLAEDVVQETFVKFWEQKKELVASPDAKYYLVTAVRNNSITALRKQAKSGVQLTETTPEPTPEPFITNRQIREDAGEQARKIADALEQLPPKCKEVFLLVKLQGMSYKQAAETLDISVKTVENQMGKAIKTLRDYVQQKALTISVLILILINMYSV